jgi:hypothetical protein
MTRALNKPIIIAAFDGERVICRAGGCASHIRITPDELNRSAKFTRFWPQMERCRFWNQQNRIQRCASLLITMNSEVQTRYNVELTVHF